MDATGRRLSGLIVRPRLLARLEGVLTHRLTTVVADVGFGKSLLLEQLLVSAPLDGVVVVRPGGRDLSSLAGALVRAIGDHSEKEGHRLGLVVGSGTSGGDDRPGALAGMVCASLAGLPGLELLVVLEDVHGLHPGALRFLERLVRQAPQTVHLLVLSRTALPFPTERLNDDVLSLTGTDLGFDADELADVLVAVLGDDEHAEAVRRLTGGWPAAVRLAAAALARRPPSERADELARLQTQGATFLGEFADQVLQSESPTMRRLSQLVAPYDGFTAELAEALGCDAAGETIADLESRGIVVRLGVDRFQYFAFPRLLRDFLRQRLPMSPEERPGMVRRAAAWFEEHGQVEGALRCAVDQADSAWVARLLREHGLALVAASRGARVATALEVVAPADFDAALHEVAGAVREARSDGRAALASYQEAARGRETLSARLAWRTGVLHYQHGELDQALAVMQRVGPPGETEDDAMLLAWRATVLWARGQAEDGRQVAGPALALAERLGDARALAAVHIVLALLAAHDGDRVANRRHYEKALEHADAAGDVMQVIRIRNNLGSRLLEEGELSAALEQLEIAIELAEASGLHFYLSLALSNRGELRLHLGQFDAATADLETARDLDRQASAPSSSSALVHLGHVYRHRGYATLSRLSYEEAIRAGRQAGDVNLLVPALCGLAQLLCDSDLERAQRLAAEALSYDSGLGRVSALLAAAWVALAQGEPEQARQRAQQGLAEADLRRDRLGRAEALHLLVLADGSGPPDDPRLVEAAGLVQEIGAPVWRARIQLTQARRTAGPEGSRLVTEIELLARSLGARALADEAAAYAREIDVDRAGSDVEIRTLGGFLLRRLGRPLGPGDWSEESARAVLKRLTAAHGASWPRAALARSLGPGATPEDLDVALAHARAVLDPERTFAADHFIVDGGDTVALRNVDVDVHLFLEKSARGLALPDGTELLRAAEARYGGDFLEEHPAEPWAVALREEARSRYVEVSRTLAADAVQRGDPEAAARYSRRILERDPYDEQAHLSLIASLDVQGRSPEARRCYSTYVQRLEELGLEAVPWAQVAAPVTGGSRILAP